MCSVEERRPVINLAASQAPPSPKTGGNQRYVQFIILVAILIIAAGLRFYKLGDWSFWSDELFSISHLEDGFNFSIFRQSLAINLIQAICAWLGINEWNARLAPALIGLLTVPAFYFPIKRLSSPWVALVSVGLLAVSPWHIYWSQNARFYSLLFLFYNLGLLFFFIGEEEHKPTYTIGSIIFFGLAARESLVALFIFPVIIGYYLLLMVWLRKPGGLNWRSFWLYLLPGAALGLAFAWPYLMNLHAWLTAFGRVNNDPFWLISGTVYYVGLPTVVIAGFGATYFLQGKSRLVLLLAVSGLLPLLLLIGISGFHYTAIRYIFMTLFSWIFLAALTGIKLFELLSARSLLLAGIAVALMAGTSLSEDILYYRYQKGNRDDWKSAFQYVSQHLLAGDVVVSANQLIGDYYLQYRTVPLANWDALQINPAVRTWFIEDLTVKDQWPENHRWIETNTRLCAVYDVHANARTFTMRVYLYEPSLTDHPWQGACP